MRELVERAVAGGPRRVAVPGAESQSALDAVVEARARGLADPVLLGDRPALEAELRRAARTWPLYAIHHAPETAQAARRAVALVRGARRSSS